MCRLIDIEKENPEPICGSTNGIEYFEGSYNEFFTRYLTPNRPCIVKNVTNNWKSSKLWVNTNDTPNLDYLCKCYGEAEVTVANCDEKYYNAQLKTTIKFSEFARHWKYLIENDHPKTKPCLYLKVRKIYTGADFVIRFSINILYAYHLRSLMFWDNDWHFTIDFPDEEVYTVPPEFCNDWLNEYFTENEKLNDDYRFIYMGPKGSWTPFHVDVFTSYSWSVNICGEKKWILLPPKEEKKLKDKFGSLPYDISFLDDDDKTEMDDIEYFIVHQKAGDAIFVPSGWHHQVWNTRDTISINHNWVNACCIDRMLSSMFSNLEEVKKEIMEFRDTMDNWIDHCQLLLKSCFGMDFQEFDQFLSHIADKRKHSLFTNSVLKVYGNWFIGFNHLKYDLKKLEDVRTVFLTHPDVSSLFQKKVIFD